MVGCRKEYYAEDYEKYEKEREKLKQSIRDRGYDISDDESYDDYYSSKRNKIELEYDNVKYREIIDNYPGEIEYDYQYPGELDSHRYGLNSDGLAKIKELEKEKESMLAKIDNERERVDRAKQEIEGRYKWEEKIDFVKIAYKREDKIQEIINRLYPVGISNIRNVSFDKENKKCDCEATLKWGDNKSKEIYFTAQRNTDGDLYVEVMQ